MKPKDALRAANAPEGCKQTHATLHKDLRITKTGARVNDWARVAQGNRISK